MTKFCDLNVIEANSLAENVANIKQLIKLGYQVIAINRMHDEPSKTDGKQGKKTSAPNLLTDVIEKIKADLRSNDPDSDCELHIPESFELLSRITIPLNNLDQVALLRSNYFKELLPQYDLISFIPGNEKVFKSLADGKIEFDIITLPLERKFEFKLTREMMGLLIAREYAFEISYSAAIRSVSLRKYIFFNSKELVRKTKHGKGIYLSSAGESFMDFRSPKDVANLANLFDLKGASCLEAIDKSPQKVVTHSRLRKTTFKGAVSVEKISENIAPNSKRRKIM